MEVESKSQMKCVCYSLTLIWVGFLGVRFEVVRFGDGVKLRPMSKTR